MTTDTRPPEWFDSLTGHVVRAGATEARAAELIRQHRAEVQLYTNAADAAAVLIRRGDVKPPPLSSRTILEQKRASGLYTV